MIKTVSFELGISLSAITEMAVKGSRRSTLLSTVTASYLVTVTSGKTPDSYINALENAVSNGDFDAYLSSESGLSISSSGVLTVINISPAHLLSSELHSGVVLQLLRSRSYI